MCHANIFLHKMFFILLKKLKKLQKKTKLFIYKLTANKELSSTIECVAFALALKNLGINEKRIILSGGTNEYTRKLCDKLSINPLAVAFGTYARKSVSDLDKTDAFNFAKKLVKNASGAENV